MSPVIRNAIALVVGIINGSFVNLDLSLAYLPMAGLAILLSESLRRKIKSLA